MHLEDWSWSWSSNTLAPDVKNWLIRKQPDTGKGWRQEEKGATEDEIVDGIGGHEFKQAPADCARVRSGNPAVVAKSQTLLSDWTVVNRVSQ